MSNSCLSKRNAFLSTRHGFSFAKALSFFREDNGQTYTKIKKHKISIKINGLV